VNGDCGRVMERGPQLVAVIVVIMALSVAIVGGCLLARYVW